MKKLVIVLVIIFIAASGIKLISRLTNDKPYVKCAFACNEITLGEAALSVKIADTPRARAKGLSGRETLDADEGMLFVFDEPGKHGIWMKDMRFPIDIIWLRGDLAVAGIRASVSPDTYPQIFYPNEPALYVLEVNAGWTARNGIKPGMTIEGL